MPTRKLTTKRKGRTRSSKATKPAKKRDRTHPEAAKKKRPGPQAAGPVARVWEIASSMPDAARKDVVAACLAKGINVHTARTQYQRWRQAQTAK